MERPSYHDMTIETSSIAERSLADLPFGLQVLCTRECGWQLWMNDGLRQTLLAGEYEDDKEWLVLRVLGNVIVDSRPNGDEKGEGMPPGWTGGLSV